MLNPEIQIHVLTANHRNVICRDNLDAARLRHGGLSFRTYHVIFTHLPSRAWSQRGEAKESSRRPGCNQYSLLWDINNNNVS